MKDSFTENCTSPNLGSQRATYPRVSKTTVTREYDEKGRVVKETTTNEFVDSGYPGYPLISGPVYATNTA